MAKERVVVFGAHPDDLDWGSGGTVAVWARQGREIYYVLATSGENGRDHQHGERLSAADMAERREAEQRRAASILGVKETFFLGQPDGKVEATLAFRDQIVNVLRRLRPHIVISLDPGLWAFDNFHMYHPDHRATALAVYDAIYPAAGSPYYVPNPDLGFPPHTVHEVYFTGSARPDTYIDITETIELKIQALTSHRSQIRDAEALAQYVRTIAARHGEHLGYRYAECFRRLEVPQ